MSKGESDLVWFLPSGPKEEIVGIMIQVFSLMATHSDERSEYSKKTTKNEERKVYAGSPLTKPHMHAGSLYTKSRIYTTYTQVHH